MSIKLFQNILAYRFTDSSVIHGQTITQLNEELAERPARQPASSELSFTGFIPPCLEEDSYIERIDRVRDSYVLAVMTHERMIPGKVVRTEVSRRVAKIESAEARKVYAREKQRLKDEVVNEFLPRAFIDHKITYVMISGPYLFVDASSAKRGEDVLSVLRETLGTLPVRPVSVKGTPIDTFTRWVTEQAPEGFRLTGDFKANGLSDESDLLTGKGVDLNDPELHEALVVSGRRITQLGLSWAGRPDGFPATFSVNEMLGVKGIKWDEALSETVSNDAGETDDAGERRVLELRASLLLLASSLRSLWSDLLSALGGEDAPEGEPEVSKAGNPHNGSSFDDCFDEEDLV